MGKTINIDGKKVTIFRLIDESNTIYEYRYNYIKENLSTYTLKKLIINSKIIANIKFKKCRYEAEIFNSFKSFINEK